MKTKELEIDEQDLTHAPADDLFKLMTAAGDFLTRAAKELLRRHNVWVDRNTGNW